MTGSVQWVVISDLDGSLLNHDDYSWDKALPAIEYLRNHRIPIIFNTSKTYLETIDIQDELGVMAPFVVENGSCIYLPKAQFQYLPNPYAVSRNGYWEIKYGKNIQEINKCLKQVISNEDDFTLLSECSPKQASDLTGLSLIQAKNAIAREFSQPLIWNGSAERFNDFKHRLFKQGLTFLQGGRFLHIQGKTDKGFAVEKLQSFFSGQLKTVVIGDSANDIDMLRRADVAIIVKGPGNKYLTEQVQSSYVTEKPAPEGWAEAVQYALKHMT